MRGYRIRSQSMEEKKMALETPVSASQRQQFLFLYSRQKVFQNGAFSQHLAWDRTCILAIWLNTQAEKLANLHCKILQPDATGKPICLSLGRVVRNAFEGYFFPRQRKQKLDECLLHLPVLDNSVQGDQETLQNNIQVFLCRNFCMF